MNSVNSMVFAFLIGSFSGAVATQSDAHRQLLKGETNFWFYENHKISKQIRVIDTVTVDGKFKAYKDGYGIQ